MSVELLLHLTLATSLGMALLLLLRRAVRAAFGAQVAYAAWALVPLLGLAVLMPAPMLAVPADMAMLRLEAVVVFATAPAPAGGLPVPLLAWAGGALLCAAWFALQQWRYVRGLGALSSNGEDGYLSERSDVGPALIGALRPWLVLPADFHRRYSAEERALILAHERIHLRRGDPLVNALVVGLRCLFWFNPLVHYAAARFRFDQELACDAVVLSRFPEARRSYAGAMLKTQLADPGLPVGCHWQSSHPFKERIMQLKKLQPGPRRRIAGLGAVGVLALGAAAFVWAGQGQGSAVPAAGNAAEAGPTEDVSYRRMHPPRYPVEALRDREQGMVVLRVLVGAAGEPTEIEVEQSSGSVRLDEAASEAVAQWRFNPARKGEEAVEGWVLVPVTFRLDRSDPPSQEIPGDGSTPALDGVWVGSGER